MNNKKKLESNGPFTGLWIRTANALRGGGYRSREQVRADIMSGKLKAFLSIHDYGIKADVEVVSWLVEHKEMTKEAALRRFHNYFPNLDALRKTKLFQRWNRSRKN